jgi:two-component system chemotaxis sensor kinase CheA
LNELLRIPANQVKKSIETVGDANVVRLRGELLPLIDLSSVLGVERTYVNPTNGRRYPERRQNIADRRSIDRSVPEVEYDGQERRERRDRRHHPESAVSIAVVSAGKYKYGLVVDGMHDTEEIVVKPLGKHLADCQSFAGATIMGDGTVALILDVASIGEMAALRSESDQSLSGSTLNRKTAQKVENIQSQSYLFFSNSETERFAVPLDTVERIEKIEAASIETVSGSRVLKYRGGTLPVLALEDAIVADPLPERSHYQVICFNVNGMEIGVLATPPIDAAEVEVILDKTTLKQTGVMGSAVLMDKTTLILDIDQVVKNIRPDFFHEA